jgi:transcriptional regulator with XRE-family HTH domain
MKPKSFEELILELFQTPSQFAKHLADTYPHTSAESWKSNICKYIKGTRQPDLNNAYMMARALQCSLDELAESIFASNQKSKLRQALSEIKKKPPFRIQESHLEMELPDNKSVVWRKTLKVKVLIDELKVYRGISRYRCATSEEPQLRCSRNDLKIEIDEGTNLSRDNLCV